MAARARAAAAAPGLLIDTYPVSGPPAEAVADSGSGALMLVVGSRGAGAFTALVFGSVSRYVSSHAPCLSARADLVVIGRHAAHAGRPGPGAVRHAVLNHAHGPVVTVPSA